MKLAKREMDIPTTSDKFLIEMWDIFPYKGSTTGLFIFYYLAQLFFTSTGQKNYNIPIK